MHLYTKRSLIVSSWLLLAIATYTLFTFVLPKEITATYDAKSLDTEQLIIQRKIKENKLPKLTEKIFDGKPVYSFGNGNFTTNKPAWLKDGEIILNIAEENIIAGSKLLPNTFWLVQDEDITVTAYNEFANNMNAGIGVGWIMGTLLVIGVAFQERAHNSMMIRFSSKSEFFVRIIFVAFVVCCVFLIDSSGTVSHLLLAIALTYYLYMTLYILTIQHWSHHTNEGRLTTNTT